MNLNNCENSPCLSTNECLIAGSLSGFISRAIVQPLDVLKIRFQLQVEPISPSTASKYHGLLHAIKCITREEGKLAFWKGHIPAQVQAISFSAIQFLSFEMLASSLKNLNGDPRSGLTSSDTLGTFTCGCFAGSVAAAFTQPLDVIRTRFIAQGEPKLYRSMPHAALYIASREGVAGFFRGISPSLLLVAPQTGLQFAIYHTFNQLVSTIRQLELDQPSALSSYPVGPIQSIIAGGLAGMGSKCIIYPLDMAKKRMQVQGFEEARTQFGRAPMARSLRVCLVNTWRTEGATALFKGLPPTLLKSCVSISCRFTVYEQVCRLLRFYHN